MAMTPQEHKDRHVALHRSLDELVVDYATHTGKLLKDTNVMDLIEWSYKQTQNPTPDKV